MQYAGIVTDITKLGSRMKTHVDADANAMGDRKYLGSDATFLGGKEHFTEIAR